MLITQTHVLRKRTRYANSRVTQTHALRKLTQEEEEEEREEPDEPVPEHGPPLLNPISEDTEVDSMPAW